MRVIVTGGTRWTDAAPIRRELAKLPAGTTVIHGDTAGVDAISTEVARELSFAVEAYAKEPQDYKRYGPLAWKGLNERMLQLGADLVLAFHPQLGEPGQARGTTHMIEITEHAGIEVRRFRS